MPKREATPPLDDDLKYFVVYYPYPLHADMKIPEERETFAKWVASCIGKDNFFAIYHKPSSPSMIIIEVSKSCANVEGTFLGAHKWSEFLKNPEKEQVELESKVYYCRHARSREVQKHGWKRIDVHDSWFDGWTPSTSQFVVNPYPQTRYCDLPPETQTEARLCRPLPQSAYPMPKPENPPVPGSNAWTTNRNPGSPALRKPRPALDIAVRWISNSSESSRSMTSGAPRTRSAMSPPPGLGPPPGLRAPAPQASDRQSSWGGSSAQSSELQVSTANSSDDLFFPAASSGSTVASSHVDSVKIDDLKIDDGEKNAEVEDPERYWSEQAPWKVDWDKKICPVHKQACKPGICKDMAKLERQMKKEEEAKEREREKIEEAHQRKVESNAGAWTTVENTGVRGGRGSGRGGRGKNMRGGPPEGGGYGRGSADGSSRGGSRERGTRGISSRERGAGAGSGRGGFTDRGRGSMAAERGGRGNRAQGRATPEGGRGGSAWGTDGNTIEAHEQQMTATRGKQNGRGTSRGDATDRGRGRGRGRGQVQDRPVASPPVTEKSAWADVSAQWSEGGTPWDKGHKGTSDDLPKKKSRRVPTPSEDIVASEEQTDGVKSESNNSWAAIAERTPWDDVREEPHSQTSNKPGKQKESRKGGKSETNSWAKVAERTPWDDVNTEEHPQSSDTFEEPAEPSQASGGKSESNSWGAFAERTPWDNVQEQAQGSDTPEEQAGISNDDKSESNSWARVAERTPWDDVQEQTHTPKTSKVQKKTGKGVKSENNAWAKVAERTPWDDDNSQNSNADPWSAPAESNGTSACDTDSWGAPVDNVKATKDATGRGQGPSSADPWAGRMGGPW